MVAETIERLVNDMRLICVEYAHKQLNIAEVEAGKNFQTDCNHVRDFLNAMPTIDAVPVVRGRWYEVLHDEFSDACNDYIIWSTYGCSKCGNEVMKDFNYCPNCGARMDGDSDEG